MKTSFNHLVRSQFSQFVVFIIILQSNCLNPVDDDANYFILSLFLFLRLFLCFCSIFLVSPHSPQLLWYLCMVLVVYLTYQWIKYGGKLLYWVANFISNISNRQANFQMPFDFSIYRRIYIVVQMCCMIEKNAVKTTWTTKKSDDENAERINGRRTNNRHIQALQA